MKICHLIDLEACDPILCLRERERERDRQREKERERENPFHNSWIGGRGEHAVSEDDEEASLAERSWGAHMTPGSNVGHRV